MAENNTDAIIHSAGSNTDASYQPTPDSEADSSTTTEPRERVLYTPKQAADLLQVGESWLRRQAGKRKIPCTFLGRTVRFSPADAAAIVTAAHRPAAFHRSYGHRNKPQGSTNKK